MKAAPLLVLPLNAEGVSIAVTPANAPSTTNVTPAANKASTADYKPSVGVLDEPIANGVPAAYLDDDVDDDPASKIYPKKNSSIFRLAEILSRKNLMMGRPWQVSKSRTVSCYLLGWMNSWKKS